MLLPFYLTVLGGNWPLQKMLINIIKITAILSFLLGALTIVAQNNEQQTRIYISQGAKHPALDATTKGVVEGLKDAGYDKANMDLQIEYAERSIPLAQQIANKFVSNKPDIVVGIGTMASQSFMKYVKDKKVFLIFTTVTDPIGANLTGDLIASGANVSGVSNYISLEPQLLMFKKILPNMRTLGFLYNPSEANSVSLIKKLDEICPKYGIKLVTGVVSQTSEVMQATSKLINSVDAVFISNDSTSLSAIAVIVKVAKTQRIPVFVSDTDIVKDGAIAALGPNQYELGRQTAAMIVRVLKGEDIGSMPVEFPMKNELYLNKKSARELGIVLPDELIEEADKILE